MTIQKAITIACLAALTGGDPATAQSFCMEPVEPYPYPVNKQDEPYLYEDVRREYEIYLEEIPQYLKCLAEEQNRIIERSRQIINQWQENFGDDAGTRIDATK